MGELLGNRGLSVVHDVGVEDTDSLWIEPSDLSQSMGLSGPSDAPELG